MMNELKDCKLGVIGVGNMGAALLNGIVDKGVITPGQINAYDASETRCQYLSDTLHVHAVADNQTLVEQSDVILLAVKPQYFEEILKPLSTAFTSDKLVISIAAGITLEQLNNWLPAATVVRVMPNTPSMVQKGVSAICSDTILSDCQKDCVEKILGAVGETIWVPERLINAVIGVSGSGPAYVFAFVEAMIDGGLRMGLDRATSHKLAVETIYGSMELMKQTGKHPTLLKEMVTSPGGTTIRALEALEKEAFHYTVMNAVIQAAKAADEIV